MEQVRGTINQVPPHDAKVKLSNPSTDKGGGAMKRSVFPSLAVGKKEIWDRLGTHQTLERGWVVVRQGWWGAILLSPLPLTSHRLTTLSSTPSASQEVFERSVYMCIESIGGVSY